MEHPRISDLPDTSLSADLREMASLYRVTSAIIEHRDLTSLLQTVVDAVAQALPAERVVLITFDTAQRQVQHFFKGGEGIDSVVRVGYDELEQGLSGWVLEYQTPALSPRGKPDPRESAEVQLRRQQTQCGDIIVVPLLYHDTILGTLTAINHRDGATFGQRQLDLMRAMASHCAVALTTAQYHEQLKNEIEERKQLQTALALARDQALAASRLKSEFLANMSHEIRTPMNAVLGLLRVLQDTALTPRQRDYVGKARSAAQALLGLLNDILDFSKVEAGKIILEPHPVTMEEFLRELAVLVSTGAHGASAVEILFDVDESLPTMVLADGLRLRQVLTNLCSNALKFTTQGEVALEVRHQGGDTSHCNLLFAVQDSGIGISPEHQQHIFDPFTQAEGSTTRRFGGTGLGLTICKRLVELMGGDLRVHSTIGAGSRFEFTLRLPVVQHAQPDPEPLKIGPPLRVLVVHPHARTRTLAQRALQARGIEAVGAAGPESIAAAVHALGITDAIITEQALWRDVKHTLLGAGPAPATVAITPLHGQDAQTQADGLVVLHPPYTPGMLCAALQEALHPSHSPGPNTQARAEPALTGLRILVVDDNAINQHIAQKLLQAQGAVVELASNGQQGVQAVFSAGYDAVLMDVQMPVMDGYEATRQIRQDTRFAALPIIAMTANALSSDRRDCLNAGMNDHIGKPFELEALVAKLCAHTGRERPVSPSLQRVAGTLHDGAAMDCDCALQRLGGDKALLERMVAAFSTQLAESAALMNQDAVLQDRATTTRLAHSLRGTAMTLCAPDLATAAIEFEQAAAEPATPDSALQGRLQALVRAIEQAFSKLHAQFPEAAGRVPLNPPNAQAEAAAPHAEAVRAALENLRALAQASDLQVLSQLELELPLLEQAHYAKAHALSTALERLDLQNAAHLCALWMQALAPGE